MAANLTWNSGGATPGNPADGPGNWDTLTAWWSNGTSDVVWDNVSTAVFGHANGAAGTVTIDDTSGTVTVAGLTFNAPGSGNYTIAASGSDTLTLSGASPNIIVPTGVNPTISAPIAGSGILNYTGGATITGVLIKGNTAGNGSLILSGSNTYAGSTIIENANSTATGGTSVTLNGGSLGSSGSNIYVGLSPTAAITDTSSLTLSGASSITASQLVVAFNFAESTLSTSTGATMNVNGTNTINADTITITAGRNSGNTKGGFGTLKLGSGATLTLNGSAARAITLPYSILQIIRSKPAEPLARELKASSIFRRGP